MNIDEVTTFISHLSFPLEVESFINKATKRALASLNWEINNFVNRKEVQFRNDFVEIFEYFIDLKRNGKNVDKEELVDDVIKIINTWTAFFYVKFIFGEKERRELKRLLSISNDIEYLSVLVFDIFFHEDKIRKLILNYAYLEMSNLIENLEKKLNGQ